MTRTLALLTGATVMWLTLFAGLSCNRPTHAADEVPAPARDLDPAQGQAGPATAVLAGGCFWCTEAVFEELQGVSAVVSGYAGGTAESANYEAVSGGRSDHAEAIEIAYDPAVVSYGQLLRVFFAVAHDPTQLNRQGPDHGRQYRSAIFYVNDAQKRVAEAYIEQLTEAKVFADPIVTTLEPLERFYPAEMYHQDYAEQNPAQPYVAYHALPKVEKVRKRFPDLLKED